MYKCNIFTCFLFIVWIFIFFPFMGYVCFFWKMRTSDSLQPNQAKCLYTLNIPKHKNKDREARRMRGKEGEQQKHLHESEFMTVRRSETGVCFNKMVWLLCWIISFLCASTNEIRAVIILTLSRGYDWVLCYLNHIYVPILASVCSLQDTHYMRLLNVYMLQHHMIL